FSSIRPFNLPGGEKAGREPWRSALALLWESKTDIDEPLLKKWGKTSDEIALLHSAWRQGLNSPQSSAAGRLFDAAAALIGLPAQSSYEGQAPAQLEALVNNESEMDITPIPLPISEDSNGIQRSDWEVLLPILQNRNLTPVERATIFHHTMAENIVTLAKLARDQHHIKDVGLTGGVFQNRRLTELSVSKLEASGFTVHLAGVVPSNDGGLCYGQIIEAAAQSGDNHQHESN
ncbi:MAG: carbamoyltransferase HypF, partial [Gammaproteobacteria bacterium]|nr:carbamoyltransferase HypF [Gammaproteobacteria bacterium]